MNNEFLEIIKTRRSIRKFKPEQISKESLDFIIEAGLYAPSAMNTQPWHFAVIQNKDLIDQINIDLKEAVKTDDSSKFFPAEMLPQVKKMVEIEGFSMFFGAPTIILVSEDNNSFYAKTDVALASQNIMLAAHAAGLGSCWIGTGGSLFEGAKEDEYREKLQIPQDYSLSHIIVIGEKDSNPTKAPARKENKVTYIG